MAAVTTGLSMLRVRDANNKLTGEKYTTFGTEIYTEVLGTYLSN
jgi:hypothetical protein